MKMAQNKPWCGFRRQDGEKETGIYVGDPADKNKISIKIDVDVSEALTGLKAVQREAKEAAKAIRELESAVLHKGDHIIPVAEYLKFSDIKPKLIHATYEKFGIGPTTLKELSEDELLDLLLDKKTK
jgi:hypothetical protein